MSLASLNALGLAISTLASVLMYYFPPSLRQYTEAGEQVTHFVGNPSEKGKRVGARQKRLSKAALALLVFGFLIQFIASAITLVRG